MDLPSKTYLEQTRKSSPRSVTRDCEQWFNNTYDKQILEIPEPNLGPVEAGKIYTFLYDPKHSKELAYYDTIPMFMCLGNLGNGNILGINVSFIPPRIRLKILDKFVRVFHSRFIKPNIALLEKDKPRFMKEIPFFYDVAKSMLAGSGFEHAIRSYRYDHIFSSIKIITYEDYWRLLAFTSDGIMKLNIRAIYFLYHKQPNPTHRIGQKHPKINIDPRVRPTQRHIRDRNK